MKEKKKTNKKEKPAKSVEESLQEIIEQRKTVADAYRKILQSLESKIKKNKQQ